MSVLALRYDLVNGSSTTAKEDDKTKNHSASEPYTPPGYSPGNDPSSAAANDRASPQSQTKASYVSRGNDYAIQVDPNSAQMRQYPPIYGAIPVDSATATGAYSGGHFPSSREAYVNADSNFAAAQRQGLPTDAYSQNLHWFHTGPPAYM